MKSSSASTIDARSGSTHPCAPPSIRSARPKAKAPRDVDSMCFSKTPEESGGRGFLLKRREICVWHMGCVKFEYLDVCIVGFWAQIHLRRFASRWVVEFFCWGACGAHVTRNWCFEVCIDFLLKCNIGLQEIKYFDNLSFIFSGNFFTKLGINYFFL